MNDEIPNNPLIDIHPIDTLVHVQAVLCFIQEYAAKSTEDGELQLQPHNMRVNTGLYAVLKIVNQAIDYEIGRLDADQPNTDRNSKKTEKPKEH